MRFTKYKIALLEDVLNDGYCEYCGKEYRNVTLSYNYRKPKECQVLTACCEKRKKDAQRYIEYCRNDASIQSTLNAAQLYSTGKL